MYFDELNENNHLLFAIKHYENPLSVTVDDFMEDMKKFKYLKRLFKRYLNSKVLRVNLILNHLIILFNVFGDATIPLLMYKLEKDYWSILKTFLVYLNRYPETGDGVLHHVPIDKNVKAILDAL
jgi:membrane-bound lytic murein transglycosylase MltF